MYRRKFLLHSGLLGLSGIFPFGLFAQQNPPSWQELKEQLTKRLTEINQDFRAAYAMAGSQRVELVLCQHNEGDFANNDIRIKARYLS